MKMTDMDSYFESKGFEVTRYYRPDLPYDNLKSYYEFIINKGGNYHRGIYTWPEDQLKFMDKMIADFEKEFGKSELTMQGLMDYALSRRCTVSITRNVGGPVVVEVECGANTYARSFNGYMPNREYIAAVKSMIDEITTEENDFAKYCENDVKLTKEMWLRMNPYLYSYGRDLPKIKNVIFNAPATIVFWTDNTKTVVKAQNDDCFDPEKGLAMAISKKALGNKGNYCNELKKWLPKEEESEFDKRINRILADLDKSLVQDAKDVLSEVLANKKATKQDLFNAITAAKRHLNSCLNDDGSEED